MKTRFLKYLVLASALAFVNCDEQMTAPIPNAGADTTVPGGETTTPGGETVTPGGDFTIPGGETVTPGGETIPGGEGLGGENVTPGGDVNPGGETAVSSNSEGVAIPESSSSAEAVAPSSSSEAVVESSSSEEVKPAGVFLAEGTDENKDQMQIEYIENIEPCIWDNDKKRNLCKILAYPKQLSTTQKHAVVMWGPGGGSNPKDYGGIIKRLASHGFVVIAIPESPGNASQGKAALDWLESKNKDPNDPLYNKLDMTKVGCSGHSMGGLESEQMLIKDDRVITAMLNNSGDLNHVAMSQVPANKTIGIVYGEGGMERPNAEADYNNNGVKAPACLFRMTGGRPSNECYNGECGWGHGSGPWGGMAATVAWMRWHLGGEDFRKADFVGTSGKYIDGNIIGEQGKWKGQCKNFN